MVFDRFEQRLCGHQCVVKEMALFMFSKKLYALQNIVLGGGPESFQIFQPVFFAGLFKFDNGFDAKPLVGRRQDSQQDDLRIALLRDFLQLRRHSARRPVG